MEMDMIDIIAHAVAIAILVGGGYLTIKTIAAAIAAIIGE